MKLFWKKDDEADLCTELESPSSSWSWSWSAETEVNSCIDTETEKPIKYQGKRKYINSSIFKDCQTISLKELPRDIDSTVIYEVPQNKISSLYNCKVYELGVKLKAVRGCRLLFDYRGSYICMNKNCKSICDFVGNQKDFCLKDNDVYCLICSFPATYI